MSTYYTKVVDGVTVKVTERTYRIEINTPNSELGPKAYVAVAYRERIESVDGVPTKRVVLPPLNIPLGPSLTSVMSLITGTIDTEALKSIEAVKWPLDGDGNLIPV